MRSTFKIGGIHPPSCKTASRKIEIFPLPIKAYLPLSQHIGAPSKAIVSKGDKVKRGQVIAENSGFVSAELHASISGTVLAVEDVVMPWGKPSKAIIITASDEEHVQDTADREAYWLEMIPSVCDRTLSDRLTADEIRAKILKAGIVGLGGATFPAHVKLSVRPERKPDVLIVNGCECEPYLMCDDALMCTYPGRIAEGIKLMMKAGGIKHAVIAMEDNKLEAAAAISRAICNNDEISLKILKTKYPQGGEKQLVEAVTGRRIASGQLPISVGAVVHNVATSFAVWQAVATNQPLIERVITVAGDIPEAQRKNYIVSIGMPLAELPVALPQEALAIVGGPMMGRSAVRLDAPIMKGTSGLTVLNRPERRAALACMRCGACVEACPMGLEPYLLSTYGRLRMWTEARENDVLDCLECGACSYSCPANRPLLDYIRVAKQRVKS